MPSTATVESKKRKLEDDPEHQSSLREVSYRISSDNQTLMLTESRIKVCSMRRSVPNPTSLPSRSNLKNQNKKRSMLPTFLRMLLSAKLLPSSEKPVLSPNRLAVSMRRIKRSLTKMRMMRMMLSLTLTMVKRNAGLKTCVSSSTGKKMAH